MEEVTTSTLVTPALCVVMRLLAKRLDSLLLAALGGSADKLLQRPPRQISLESYREEEFCLCFFVRELDFVQGLDSLFNFFALFVTCSLVSLISTSIS